MRQLLCLLTIAVSLLSCSGGLTGSSQGEGDTVAFKYATQLTVVRYDGYTVATIKNPWNDGKILHQYVLVADSLLADNGERPDVAGEFAHATIIRTPLKRSMIFSTVHCAMLMEMGKQACISGVADLKYIKIPWIQEQVAQGKIADVGDGLSPVVEKIIDRHPDALFMSPFENSGGYGKLEEIGIPIVECAEYMEPSPLARAEWLRFYGMLFGCERQADSLFHATDSCYNALKAIAREAGDNGNTGENGDTGDSGNNGDSGLSGGKSPSILMDKLTGNVWYVPGGRSTLGQMIADANGEYAWAKDEHSGSISLPLEAVLEKAGDADAWVFRYGGDHTISYDELRREHHGYKQFKAFADHQVYGCNVEQSTFYEETPFHPDWLLNDFIRILHPEKEGLAPLRYFQKLN